MAITSAKSIDEPVRRIQVGSQRLLVDAQWAGSKSNEELVACFQPEHWQHCDRTAQGRGSSWYVGEQHADLALRHFRRGGALAPLLKNRYWFSSYKSTRSFAEFTLLKSLFEQGLAVPQPCAAWVDRRGMFYRAGLITRRIERSRSWSAVLESEEGQSNQSLWQSVGRSVASLHNASVFHADLNAHNVLVDDQQQVYIIDFDKSAIRPEAPYALRANLQRLRRSLDKEVQSVVVVDRGWRWLEGAYFDGLSAS